MIVEASLPTGGRVWLRTRLTHAQARERDEAQESMPPAALARLVVARESGGGWTGLDDADVGAVAAATRRSDETMLRVCIVRSDGVHDPDGEPIALPADIDRLDQEDFRYLVEAAAERLREGWGDPNSSRGSSATPSCPAGSAETSPPTSAMPS